jgi:hypothetical protein
MKRALPGVVILLLAAATPGSQAPASAGDALIARAKSLELNTPYVPPPGDPLDHHTSGFAKIMCSAVFITGLDADFAAENVEVVENPFFALFTSARDRAGAIARHATLFDRRRAPTKARLNRDVRPFEYFPCITRCLLLQFVRGHLGRI